VAKNSITQDELKTCLIYNPDTGEFFHKRTNGPTKSGMRAGTINGQGYRQISVQGVIMTAGRLAWLYVHGQIPPEDIDHINRNRADDRLVNLRILSRRENVQNTKVPSSNTTGTKGVSRCSRSKRWISSITFDGVVYRLGRFVNIADAVQMREGAEKLLHPYRSTL
jgi:hypothetical protein